MLDAKDLSGEIRISAKNGFLEVTTDGFFAKPEMPGYLGMILDAASILLSNLVTTWVQANAETIQENTRLDPSVTVWACFDAIADAARVKAKVTTDTVPALINRWRSGFYYNHIDSANRLDEASEKIKALETQLDTYKTALESLSAKADSSRNH